MKHDVLDQVCSDQAFTATAVSEDSIDTLDADADPFIGRQMSMVVYPKVAAGAGSTHVLAVIEADDAALTSNVQVLASITKLAAALTVGSKHEIPIPGNLKSKRYIGLRNTISGGTTEVTLDAFLVPQDEVATYKAFPKVVGSDA